MFSKLKRKASVFLVFGAAIFLFFQGIISSNQNSKIIIERQKQTVRIKTNTFSWLITEHLCWKISANPCDDEDDISSARGCILESSHDPSRPIFVSKELDYCDFFNEEFQRTYCNVEADMHALVKKIINPDDTVLELGGRFVKLHQESKKILKMKMFQVRNNQLCSCSSSKQLWCFDCGRTRS